MMAEVVKKNDNNNDSSVESSTVASCPMSQILDLVRKNNNDKNSSNGPNMSSIRPLLHQVLTDSRIFAGFTEWFPYLKEDSMEYNTCRLFAFGTYKDYITAPSGTYLTLTETQLTKLKALTVVTLVQQCISSESPATFTNPPSTRSRLRRPYQNNNHKINTAKELPPSQSVPYRLLYSELGFEDEKTKTLDLENLLIHSCLYSNLISGKLDQKNECFLPAHDCSIIMEQNNGAFSRDISVSNDVPRMIYKLQQLQLRGQAVMAKLSEGKEFHTTQKKLQTEFFNDVEERVVKMQQATTSSSGRPSSHFISSLSPSSAFSATIDTDPTNNNNDQFLSRERRQTKRSRGGYTAA